MRDLQQHFTRLGQMLAPLRGTFDAIPGGEREAAYFSEYLEVNEFGLALHTLCDFLLEFESVPITQDLLDKIQELHVMMELKDNYSPRLIARSSQ